MATNFGTKLLHIGVRERYLRAVCTYPHVSRVIVNFVPKFVAMATGVGRGEI